MESYYIAVSSLKSKTKTLPNTEFAIEPKQGQALSQDDLLKLSKDIDLASKGLKFYFETLVKNLSYMNQAYQNFQNSSQNLFEAWSESIESLD